MDPIQVSLFLFNESVKYDKCSAIKIERQFDFILMLYLHTQESQLLGGSQKIQEGKLAGKKILIIVCIRITHIHCKQYFNFNNIAIEMQTVYTIYIIHIIINYISYENN